MNLLQEKDVYTGQVCRAEAERLCRLSGLTISKVARQPRHFDVYYHNTTVEKKSILPVSTVQRGKRL